MPIIKIIETFKADEPTMTRKAEKSWKTAEFFHSMRVFSLVSYLTYSMEYAETLYSIFL